MAKKVIERKHDCDAPIISTAARCSPQDVIRKLWTKPKPPSNPAARTITFMCPSETVSARWKRTSQTESE